MSTFTPEHIETAFQSNRDEHLLFRSIYIRSKRKNIDNSRIWTTCVKNCKYLRTQHIDGSPYFLIELSPLNNSTTFLYTSIIHEWYTPVIFPSKNLKLARSRKYPTSYFILIWKHPSKFEEPGTTKATAKDTLPPYLQVFYSHCGEVHLPDLD
jgi:hypothetical protein